MGQGGEQMLYETRLSGFLPIWDTPLAKTSWEPQDDSERCLSDSVFTPLAGLLGVPGKQAGEINFRFKWENQDKGPHPELYHNYEDKITVGP